MPVTKLTKSVLIFFLIPRKLCSSSDAVQSSLSKKNYFKTVFTFQTSLKPILKQNSANGQCLQFFQNDIL